MKLEPLHWCDLTISGEKVPVILSCPKLSPSLKDSIGVTEEVSENGRSSLQILIDASLSREEQDRTLAHEFVHACLWRKKSLKLHWKKEESLAQEISWAGGRVFVWPKRPAGTRALERYAKEHNGNS